MTFDTSERATLAALADVLIPAGHGFPAASAADVTGAGLDQVLAARPDLAPALKRILGAARGQPAAAFMAELKRHDPAAFGVLTDLVPGAYFLHPDIRARLGYSGQGPRPIDPHPDYLDDGLLQAVIDRGPIYRPTS